MAPTARTRCTTSTRARFRQYEQLAPDCMGPWMVYWRQCMPGYGTRCVDDDGQPDEELVGVSVLLIQELVDTCRLSPPNRCWSTRPPSRLRRRGVQRDQHHSDGGGHRSGRRPRCTRDRADVGDADEVPPARSVRGRLPALAEPAPCRSACIWTIAPTPPTPSAVRNSATPTSCSTAPSSTSTRTCA